MADAQHSARGPPQRPAPARRQHDRRRGSHPEAAAAAREHLPQSVRITQLTDRTTTIRGLGRRRAVRARCCRSCSVVGGDLPVPARSLAGDADPRVAVPLSLVGTFGVMYLLGFSLNNLSLMALTIATGFVVDDAIVMIENIARYIEDGRGCRRAGGARGPADRLHHPVAHGVAGRGADPAALHGATWSAACSASSRSRSARRSCCRRSSP